MASTWKFVACPAFVWHMPCALAGTQQESFGNNSDQKAFVPPPSVAIRSIKILHGISQCKQLNKYLMNFMQKKNE